MSTAFVSAFFSLLLGAPISPSSPVAPNVTTIAYTPAPAPVSTVWTSPSSSPSSPASVAPVGSDPLPSSNFARDLQLTGDIGRDAFPSSPLRIPIASQPHTTLPAAAEVAAWNAEVAGGNAGSGPFFAAKPLGYGIPIYPSSDPADPVISVGRCTASYGCRGLIGATAHLSPNALIQSRGDQHMLIVDALGGTEIDCWQALSKAGSQSSGQGDMHVAGPIMTCSSGGVYRFGTTGLRGSYANETPGGKGIHFGPAAGSFFVTPNEMLRGQINHALAINTNCANARNIYPGDDRSKTDTWCFQGGDGPPHYGDAFVLNWTPAQIAASSHSTECKAVLLAAATFGIYVSDTGDKGGMIDTVSEYSYTADPGELGPDPWPQVRADMEAAGDAKNGVWWSCGQGLGPSDFSLVELTPP